MRINDVTKWSQAGGRLFRPFRMVLTGGTAYVVRHPDQVLVNRSVVTVYAPPPPGVAPDGFDVDVALVHIIRIEPFIEPTSPPAPPANGQGATS